MGRGVRSLFASKLRRILPFSAGAKKETVTRRRVGQARPLRTGPSHAPNAQMRGPYKRDKRAHDIHSRPASGQPRSRRRSQSASPILFCLFCLVSVSPRFNCHYFAPSAYTHHNPFFPVFRFLVALSPPISSRFRSRRNSAGNKENFRRSRSWSVYSTADQLFDLYIKQYAMAAAEA